MDKLPDVSFENTLRSCLEHKAYGIQPGHAQFYYPKNMDMEKFGNEWQIHWENILRIIFKLKV